MLQKAAVGSMAVGGRAAPMISRAQTVNLRFQSSWPAKDIFHEYANAFAKEVNDLAGGQLKVEVLPSGSVVTAPMPAQPLGRFKKLIAKVEDLKGLKYRTVGLSINVFKEMGASVNPLPGGEIVPALDRSLPDAAAFNNPSSDRLLGFPDLVKNCLLQSLHQSGEQFEILFNKGK